MHCSALANESLPFTSSSVLGPGKDSRDHGLRKQPEDGQKKKLCVCVCVCEANNNQNNKMFRVRVKSRHITDEGTLW